MRVIIKLQQGKDIPEIRKEENKMKKLISLILAVSAVFTMTVFAGTASANLITVEQAKSIALEHANLKETDVKFTKAELELDDGRYEYDIEFRTDRYNEYDYTIDAESGKILEFEHDIENDYYFDFDFDYILSLIIRFFENLFRQAA